MEKPLDKPKTWDERRQHRRILRNFILSYYEKGKALVQHDISQINNISQGGMSFISTRPLKAKTIVFFDVKTSFTINAIHLEGAVLECEEKVPNMIYSVRVQFNHTPEQALNVLRKIENFET